MNSLRVRMRICDFVLSDSSGQDLKAWTFAWSSRIYYTQVLCSNRSYCCLFPRVNILPYKCSAGFLVFALIVSEMQWLWIISINYCYLAQKLGRQLFKLIFNDCVLRRVPCMNFPAILSAYIGASCKQISLFRSSPVTRKCTTATRAPRFESATVFQ